jgi:hypothetical protein
MYIFLVDFSVILFVFKKNSLLFCIIFTCLYAYYSKFSVRATPGLISKLPYRKTRTKIVTPVEYAQTIQV